ncbi:MAG: DUF3035 domain-containing protein [Alphaproteobacteria bacterium]|jgi:hypothetical protein|nr:DUF3035 domain-containing protein [Alphaproteobacteria bacterium]MDP6832396.1 DUF3035 domain-containing protein [Alphaproteobacteria bacterium]MDP6874447.1 DUF3035 domain-containing protein [Alphaproteobacteria bacterium]
MAGKYPGVAIAALLAFGLTACDTIKEQAGLTKKAPDEFTVITKAPLVMPPDFSLRPPRPGAKRPQEVQPRDRARAAIASASKGRKNSSAKAQQAARDALSTAAGKSASGKAVGGELALLQKAGAANADPAIREIVNRETSVLAEKDKSFADRLLFWQDKPAYGAAVDASKEARRLREAAAAGEAPNKGETPVIKRRKRGWLEGIF